MMHHVEVFNKVWKSRRAERDA